MYIHLFAIFQFFIIFYFLFSAGYYTYKIYTLKVQEKNLNNKLTELDAVRPLRTHFHGANLVEKSTIIKKSVNLLHSFC